MNQKGQALIESMLLLALVMPASFYLIKIGLHLQQEILVDEVMEEALLCHYKKKTSCIQDIKRQLNQFSKKPVYAKFYNLHNEPSLEVIMETRYGTTLHVQSKMSLNLLVP